MAATEKKETYTGKELVIVQPPAGVTLQLASTPVIAVPKQKPRKRVLDEDTYIEAVDKIIQRDFFPDLPMLRNQHEWLQAEANNDIEKMREIHQRLRARPSSSIRATPSSFESATPHINPSFTPSQRGSGAVGGPTPGLSSTSATALSSSSSSPPKEFVVANSGSLVDTGMSLDDFQFKNTSEDNAAFDELLERHNEQKRRKYAWMIEKEKETQLLLEEGRKDTENKAAAPLMWAYKAQNLLMYNADGVPFTDREEQSMSASAPKQLIRENTRLQPPETHTPSNTPNAVRESESDRGMYNMLNNEELRLLRERKARDAKIDLDDLRATPGRFNVPQSPRVGGYGFIATPSPAPGVDASPIMTWGDVMGTPMRVDDTPIGGPQFKVSELPDKDKLLMQLTEQVKQRKKKSQSTAKVAVSSLLASSPVRPGSTTPLRSPLVTGIDTQLRASYGKSPLVPRTPHTPTHSSSVSRSVSTPVATPSHKDGGVFAKPAPRSLTSSSSSSSKPSSITDNLLNI